MINISKLYCGLAGESDKLRYASSNSLAPVTVFNCTRRCNLRCLHCYSFSNQDRADDELTTQQAKQLLSQLKEVNSPVVLFSGGEPMLREDLFELLAEAKKIGLRTVISTNGTLIDSAAAKKLAEVGIAYVGISLDGMESFHDKFRATKGSFNAVMAGIENCKKAGLRTGLRFTITKQNADQVPFIFDIALSTGVRRLCFYHLIRSGRATELEGQSLPMQEERRIMDMIIDKANEFVQKGLLDEQLTVGNHADGPYLLVRMAKEKAPRFEKARQLLLANGGNKIGEKIACVSWNGNVYPDQFWRNYCLGNIKDKTFGQIWLNPDEPVLKKLRDKSNFACARCKGCKWFDLCKGNFRFTGADSSDENWTNEPPCYLTDDEIKKD